MNSESNYSWVIEYSSHDLESKLNSCSVNIYTANNNINIGRLVDNIRCLVNVSLSTNIFVVYVVRF